MIDRDRTFHRLMAVTRKKKAEDRHAREALAEDNLYPRIAALSRPVLRSKKCHPRLRKVLLGQGEWPLPLQDTPDRDWKE